MLRLSYNSRHFFLTKMFTKTALNSLESKKSGCTFEKQRKNRNLEWIFTHLGDEMEAKNAASHYKFFEYKLNV